MSPTGTKNGSSGFTLIELLVLLVALVVLATVVVPAFRGTGRQGDLDGTAARVAATARYARQTATSEGVGIALWIEPESRSVRLAVEEDALAPALPALSLPTEAQEGTLGLLSTEYALVSLPPGVAAHFEPVSDSQPMAGLLPAEGLRFRPEGRTEGGVIVLTDERGRERRVLVTHGVGQVLTDGAVPE